MKKRYIFLGVIVAALAAGYYLTPSLESIVKNIVHKYGSQVTGTDVSLGGFNLSLQNGMGQINNLKVANPKGYDMPNVISLGEVRIKVNLKSLTTNTIIIDEVIINKPIITYEMLSLTRNNIKQLQENITKNTASANAEIKQETIKAEATKSEPAAAKKVIIKLVNITGGQIQAIATVPGKSQNLELVLPDIQIKGIGENTKGATIPDTISRILNQVLNVASQSIVKSNFGDLKSLADDNLNNVVGGVKDRVKSLGVFGK